MNFQGKMDSKKRSGIDKLSELLKEIYFLKKQTVDKSLLRDYDIYIRDIQRFLEKASVVTPSLDDIQAYIDDYQGVILQIK